MLSGSTGYPADLLNGVVTTGPNDQRGIRVHPQGCYPACAVDMATVTGIPVSVLVLIQQASPTHQSGAVPLPGQRPRSASTQAFISVLASETGIPVSLLVDTQKWGRRS